MKHFKDWNDDWPRCRQDDYRLDEDLSIVSEASLSQENIEVIQKANRMKELVGHWL